MMGGRVQEGQGVGVGYPANGKRKVAESLHLGFRGWACRCTVNRLWYALDKRIYYHYYYWLSGLIF